MNQSSIELMLINRLTGKKDYIGFDKIPNVESVQEIADNILPFALFSECELYFKVDDKVYEIISVLTDTTCVIEECTINDIIKEFN